jgi:hypothetical protein
MRLWVKSGFVLILAMAISTPLAAAPCNNDARPADKDCASTKPKTGLRLNQLQMVGTAESYKQAPSKEMLSLIAMGGKKDALALNFSEPSLADQLNAGALALSFDIAYDPKGGLFKNPAGASMAGEVLDPAFVDAMSQPGFKVIHVLDVDYRSSCPTLYDCLTQVATWSRAHKNHMPIVITLHVNDTKTPMPGAVRPMPCDAATLDALDNEIGSVFKTGELIVPDQVRSDRASLREAVLAGDWPTLRQARGKIILLLDGSAKKADIYGGSDHSLAGKPMFVIADEASPMASFIAIDDPVKEGARIAADIRQGFMVMTRADNEAVEARANNTTRRDQAFASGAQIIQTDFLLPDKAVGPYQVSIADSRHAQCNATVAQDHCAAWNASLKTAARAP